MLAYNAEAYLRSRGVELDVQGPPADARPDPQLLADLEAARSTRAGPGAARVPPAGCTPAAARRCAVGVARMAPVLGALALLARLVEPEIPAGA